MFDYGPYTDLILASYIISGLVFLLMLVWVYQGESTQRKALKRLEKQGIKRRSS